MTLVHIELWDQKHSYIGGSHSSELGIGIIRGSDLDDVRGHNLESIQAAQDGAQFARRPTSGLRGAGRRCKGGIDRVDLVEYNRSNQSRFHMAANNSKNVHRLRGRLGYRRQWP